MQSSASRRSSFAQSKTRNCSFQMHLSGDDTLDKKIVCEWIARSYGEIDKEYHEAYSRQILKQFTDSQTNQGPSLGMAK